MTNKTKALIMLLCIIFGLAGFVAVVLTWYSVLLVPTLVAFFVVAICCLLKASYALILSLFKE